jgi:hypothetical protein
VSTFDVDSKKCLTRTVEAKLESTFDVDRTSATTRVAARRPSLLASLLAARPNPCAVSTFDVDSKKCLTRTVEPKLESTFDVDLRE